MRLIVSDLHYISPTIFVYYTDFFYFSRKKIHFFLDSNENCCTFAVFYLTNTLTQNITT